ncbi:hypothetical protein ACO0K9_20715 [Undibacterium sp. Ji50W]|uniref:hypothetical protein n=1 Tax=Undibacterium sp. Ji50W TaxID=3413041 RepID=UPI003BEF718B
MHILWISYDIYGFFSGRLSVPTEGWFISRLHAHLLQQAMSTGWRKRLSLDGPVSSVKALCRQQEAQGFWQGEEGGGIHSLLTDFVSLYDADEICEG